MCAVVFDSPEARGSAPVYHFQISTRRLTEVTRFTFKIKQRPEQRSGWGAGHSQGNQVPLATSWEILCAYVQIAADTLVTLYNSNSGVSRLKSRDTLGESPVCLLTCYTWGQLASWERFTYQAYWNVSVGGQLDKWHQWVPCYCDRTHMSEWWWQRGETGEDQSQWFIALRGFEKKNFCLDQRGWKSDRCRWNWQRC